MKIYPIRPIDREEKEQIEIQMKNNENHIKMTQNLIDLLFQTEKDKEKERL